ncbi:MAG: macro domain-containing protein [Eggerthia catenaformis]|uniref:macro domain-containing protein n=1 Tax=Eggerthia catenaformis TaxID=31973 RepID=UPI003FA06FDF
MKVHFLDKKLWSSFFVVLSGMSVLTSLICIFVDIPDRLKIYALIVFAIILCFVFCLMWYRANKLNKVTLNINNSIMEIEIGDIFSEEGFKVISFNEYFDTNVDGVIVSSKTLNGKYIQKYYPDTSVLNEIIKNDTHAKSSIISQDKRSDEIINKYKLGTIIKNNTYFLLAFSHFDENNRAYIEMNDYISCLLNMWNECDIHYGGETVILPLLGAGITRFHGYENICEQELLETIIWTFKVSRVRFQYPAKVKIVLTDEAYKKINLYSLQKHSN